MYLYTDTGQAITSKEDYVTGTYTLNEGEEEVAGGTLRIRGRGNSTWDWPKKPYRLKFDDSSPLLGMPKSKNWVLLANYADKTLMRNDIAFMLGERLGMAWTPHGRYVDVWMNDVYGGVYQLVEHIRIDNDRIDIDEMEETDTGPETMTGGYLIEIDFRMHEDYCLGAAYDPVCVDGVNTAREGVLCLDSEHGMNPFCLDEPEDLLEPEWAVQRNYIETYFTDTEAALFGENFADPDLGYAAYLDVDSTINYYIINELLKNPDGATASAYITKPRNGKFQFGPIWDFDLSLGNAGYSDVDKTYGWHTRKASWFARLFEDPAFAAKAKARWQQLKADGSFELIFMYAQARATWLEEAQQRNFAEWPIFYWEDWYTRVIMGSYAGEVNEMIRWQRERYEWMDAQMSQ